MKNLMVFLLTVLPFISNAQDNWLWAKSIGGISDDYGRSVVTDINGNILVTGNFISSNITFGTTILNNAGSADIFLVKYDPNGNVLWAKSAGSSGNDEGNSIATDANGNILVTGNFYGSNITFGSTTLNNAGYMDIFLVKYDPNGNVLWAKSAGGSENDEVKSVTTDANGNILVTGYFWSSTITFGTTTLNTAGGWDIFLVKYDPNGNVLWAKSAGGSENDEGKSVTTDASENILVTGQFYSPTITFGTTTLNNAGVGSLFLVKYDPYGNVLWEKSAGGSSSDKGYSVATDVNGNILVTGYFYSSAITFGTTTLNNAGSVNPDVFLVKYDSNGNVLWAKSAGGSSYDEGRSVTTDANGNILVTGYFGSSAITFGTTTLNNAGGADIFLVKYDTNGNVLWAKSAGSSDSDYGNSVATDINGNILVNGYFGKSIPFGTTTLNTAGGWDIFLAKLKDGANTALPHWVTNPQTIEIYPIPANNILNIKIQNPGVGELEIKLFNMLGAELKKRKYNAGYHQIETPFDLSGLVPQLYFVQVNMRGSVRNYKVAVME